MPIKVALQTIDGKKLKEISTFEGALNRLLPIGNSRFPTLRYIDFYGDTLFNGQQMYPVLEELDRLTVEVSSEEDKQALEAVRKLAIECRDRPHTFLRFIGD